MQKNGLFPNSSELDLLADFFNIVRRNKEFEGFIVWWLFRSFQESASLYNGVRLIVGGISIQDYS